MASTTTTLTETQAAAKSELVILQERARQFLADVARQVKLVESYDDQFIGAGYHLFLVGQDLSRLTSELERMKAALGK
jgi:hypothetical protein